MTFTRKELASIEAWTDSAKPLDGIYYRSVEYRFMDPAEVLNGKGTATYGGRFASVGTRAVFLAASDAAAAEEVLARKSRLGDNAQITLAKYPRIVFGVNVSLQRVLDLSKTGLPKEFAIVRKACLDPDALGSVDGSWKSFAGAFHPRSYLSKRGGHWAKSDCLP